MTGKHPVSALVELCNRRKWGAPVFELVHESGPDHKKNFLFKVNTPPLTKVICLAPGLPYVILCLHHDLAVPVNNAIL